MYSLVIYLYLFAVKVAALFNHKARLLLKGHYHVFKILRAQIQPGERYLWFHAASLGEFEQGRPLMEHIRRNYPQYKILLTFFSPSGYEVRKNYKGADVICYLPFDTPTNVHRFFKYVHPEMAFFIKYEFWQNYLKAMEKRHIKVYSVCSIFRPNQVFFQWYGGQYYKALTRFTWLYVQNEDSKRLLAKRGITNTSVVGDIRFDRVIDIKNTAEELPLIQRFCGNSLVFIAGSSWEPDENIYIPYFLKRHNCKLIIAPHVVNESRLAALEKKLSAKRVMRYSRTTAEDIADADCLLIDCYGLLSSIYRYGTIAYIGGGFGVGIHNVPEAAVYGIPVVFGPNNKRFQEAQALLKLGGAFEITNAADFKDIMHSLINDADFRRKAGENAGNYIADNAGAVTKIMKTLEFE